MSDETPSLQSLHALYEKLTGLTLRFDFKHVVIWRTFLSSGYTAIDLAMVVRHLRKKIQDERRLLSAFNINFLVRDLDHFGEDLAEAKALERAPKYCCGKAAVLRATGRQATPEPCAARTPEQIMAASKAFEEFRKLKETL